MKTFTLITLLFTNISFAATFSQETQEKLRPIQIKTCIKDFVKHDTKVSLDKIEAYCDCGVRNILSLTIEEQNNEQAIILAIEPCLSWLIEN